MLRYLAVICCFILVAIPALSHEDGVDPDIDLSKISVPQNIQLFDFIRFTRTDSRLVLSRMTERGDAHHIGTMTQPLTKKALAASAESPRAASKLVFEMAQIGGSSERAARLAAEEQTLRDILHETQRRVMDYETGATEAPAAEIEAAHSDLATIEALIDLVSLWQQNPMDGAGS